MTKTLPLVSIIITTKNEQANIQTCLKSIVQQTYKNIEIIVIDNFSTDKTQQIASKYTDKIFNKGPERSAQRNYGMIDIAQGEYVMYIDADMILSLELVSDCVDFISKNNYLALQIPEIILGKSFWSQVRRFERKFYDGTVIDGARFFDSKTFKKVGGFDITMSGPEDWDIDKEIKQIGNIGLLKSTTKQDWTKSELHEFILQRGIDPDMFNSVIYHNESEFNIGKYLSKKAYYSQSFDTYINKRGKNDADISKQLGIYYRFIGVFIEHGKGKTLLTHPILTLGMYILRFLVGIRYIFRNKNGTKR